MMEKSKLSTVQKRQFVDFIIYLFQIVCFTSASTVWYFRGSWVLGTVFLLLDIAIIVREIMDVYKLIRRLD